MSGDRPRDEPLAFIDLAAQRRALGSAVDEAMARVVEHGRFVRGPEVDELEHALASRAGVAHAIGCSSGTDALFLVLLAAGVGPGDAVIVPSFTFAATAGAVLLAGATPVFVDVDERTACIDPSTIEKGAATARAGGLRPVAVAAVDLFGHPADHAEVAARAADEGLWVLDDAAQGFGAAVGGRAVGSFGRAAALSFFPSKPLGAYGDGGAVLTDDDDLADQVVSRREHGRGADPYDIQRLGTNARLDTLQAAVLLQKLALFDGELAARDAVADRYDRALAALAVDRPVVVDGCTSAWAQYTIRVDGRDEVAAALAEQGVPSAVHYPRPLHQQPAFVGAALAGGDLSRSERLAQRVLSLPMHPYLQEHDQDRVVAALARALEQR